MDAFLAFLNSADAARLTQTPGVTPTLAEGIIAARPFESAADCLKVRGMGKTLLARLEAEAGETTGKNEALQPVEEQAAPIVTAPAGADESAASNRPSFGARTGALLISLFRGLVRLLALVIIVGALAALVYYGLPILRNYLIAPIEQNRAEIVQLKVDLETLRAQAAGLQTQQAETGGRAQALEQSVAAHGESLAKLAEMQAALEADMSAGDAKLSASLAREIALTRTIEYLSRARLYLSQSNFGLAREDVQSARDLLAATQAENPDFKAEAISQVLLRLDLALGNLPAFPVVAVSDVDIALQLLMSGLPEHLAFPSATPTPTPTETALPEASATPEASVTPTP
ncbi:MAG: hypothetical protein HFACDABA_00416 [Anaerolineales bacterium]|nr:hypothetical protein [Anaerolineales bacterium]